MSAMRVLQILQRLLVGNQEQGNQGQAIRGHRNNSETNQSGMKNRLSDYYGSVPELLSVPDFPNTAVHRETRPAAIRIGRALQPQR